MKYESLLQERLLRRYNRFNNEFYPDEIQTIDKAWFFFLKMYNETNISVIRQYVYVQY